MNRNLGENIYVLRSAKNWSQTELAEALDVSRQSISKWENNAAVPDLERLIKMSEIFDVTLDELVFGNNDTDNEEKEQAHEAVKRRPLPPTNIIAGCAMLVFGMVFFLLSIFWGDHLYFGEAFGELLSAVIVLLSLALIATNNTAVMTVSAVIYFLYSVVCFGFLHVTSLSNYLFTFISGIIVLVWFIVWGENKTKELNEGEKEKEKEKKKKEA